MAKVVMVRLAFEPTLHAFLGYRHNFQPGPLTRRKTVLKDGLLGKALRGRFKLVPER